MALRSAASAPNLPSQPGIQSRPFGSALALLWATFLTLVVAGPWLLPGYLFGTDWPGPMKFPMPAALDSSALLRVGLSALAWVGGGEATGKLFVLGFLFASAALAYTA